MGSTVSNEVYWVLVPSGESRVKRVKKEEGKEMEEEGGRGGGMR